MKMKQLLPEAKTADDFKLVDVTDTVYRVTLSQDECKARGYLGLFGKNVRVITQAHKNAGWVYVTTLDDDFVHSYGIELTNLEKI